MIKLKLKPKKQTRSNTQFPWKTCAPFVDNRLAQLIHRPRAVTTYTQFNYPYIAMSLWCGNSFCGEDKFTFSDVVPNNGKLLCARCEAMAVANGLPSADELTGMHVHQGKLVPVRTCKH